MSKEMREQIDRVRNWGQFLNENNKLNKTIITESFLSSQSHIYQISKEVVSKLNLKDIINYLIDDIENVLNIEILLNDYKINCEPIFYKWSQKEDVDDDFSSFLDNTNTSVVFTNKLSKGEFAELIYDNHKKTTMYINYNDQKSNNLLYNDIRNSSFEVTEEYLNKFIKKYILPSYINTVSHELRHLFDDYRSNNKIGNDDYINTYGDDYLSQTTEVWARFTEILNDIRRKRLRIKDFNMAYGFLSQNFNGFNQLPMKLRSKLTSYLYKFINK